jgi:multicomponent Na+:H+ antiporter subunit E
MLFANLISLTPGTLSLDVSDDRSTLYVHAMDTDDADGEKADMKRTFEKKIREAMQ